MTKHPSNGTYFLCTKPFPFLTTLSLSSQPPNFNVIRFLSYVVGFAPISVSAMNPHELFCS